MYQPTKTQSDTLVELNADYRFCSFSTGGIMKWNPETGTKERVDASGKCVCIITDRQTGEEYAFGCGISEEVAFCDALENAVVAPKPLTRAQQYEVKCGEANKRAELLLEAKTKLTEELDVAKRRIAELEEAASAGTAPRGGNRRQSGVFSSE